MLQITMYFKERVYRQDPVTTRKYVLITDATREAIVKALKKPLVWLPDEWEEMCQELEYSWGSCDLQGDSYLEIEIVGSAFVPMEDWEYAEKAQDVREYVLETLRDWMYPVY